MSTTQRLATPADKRRGISQEPVEESNGGPPSKRLRLDDTQESPEKTETVDDVDMEVEEEKPVASGSKAPKAKKNKRKREPKLPDPCSGPDVLYQEIQDLLGRDAVEEVTKNGNAFNAPFKANDEVVVTIEMVGSGGSGLARAPGTATPWAIVVPKALPGETVRVRISRWERMHSIAELLEVVENPSEWRDNSRIKCRYFSKCGGCQYQMLGYDQQLALKRDVIVRAYKRYSKLPESAIPTIGSTVGSPLEYHYRTKLTPHFEKAPRFVLNSKEAQEQLEKDVNEGKIPDWLKIGFEEAFNQRDLDIEECPIATTVINERYAQDRKDIPKKILSYKRGVGLMYRDSLSTQIPAIEIAKPPLDTLSEAFTKHVCLTDQKRDIARESVGPHGHIFEFAAGGFFQNNNSILGRLVSYVRDAVLDIQTSSLSTTRPLSLTHLVDTYCGSGLFAITLAPYFDHVAGIELSSQAIENAKHNASINAALNQDIRSKLSPPVPSESSSSTPSESTRPPTDVTFRAGEAQHIFASVQKDFDPSHTVVIIDPPRKGCDQKFLDQLVAFAPEVVVYVSCNVHTQARDIGWIINWGNGTESAQGGPDVVVEAEGEGGVKERPVYELVKLTGFDLFPQTSHVEGVAVLRRRRSEALA